jgi:hypothetical protein
MDALETEPMPRETSMKQAYKDETRWLARVLAVICVLLSIRVLIVLLQHISEDQVTIPRVAISLTVLILSLWLAYRLLICSSLWNIFSWFSETSTFVLYVQSQYYRINKHVRSGFVGGIILPIVILPLPLLLSRYHGVFFWDAIAVVFKMIVRPFGLLEKILNISGWPLEDHFRMLFIVVYLFILGFVVGVLISYLKGLFCSTQSPKDLNNGSPGCSETEPGVER